MLLLNKLLGGGALALRTGLAQRGRACFGKRKKEKDELDETDKEMFDDKEGFVEDDDEDQDVEADDEDDRMPDQIDPDSDETELVNPSFIKRSSKLYKKFIESQERAMLTKDGYQFNVGLILHRLPILLAYDADMVRTFKQRFDVVRRTEYYNAVPAELIDNVVNPLAEFEKISQDNVITHVTGTGKDRRFYAEHSKYWRFVDPTIKDPRSIQYKPCETVFLLVKDETGQWVFPDWTVKEKETFDTIKKGIAQDITGHTLSNLFWYTDLPTFVHKREIDGLPRGKGIKTFYYNATHISGKFEWNPQKRSLWKDYMWVPKGQLALHMQPQYFKRMTRSAAAPM